MKNRSTGHTFFIILFALIASGLVTYFLAGRDLVIQAYEGHAPAWFQGLVDTIYPRFSVEKHRFSLDFFLNKADQVMLRLSLVFLIAVIIYAFRNRIEPSTFKPSTKQNTTALRILFFLLMLYTSRNWYGDLIQLQQAEIFYHPISFYSFLNLPYPSSGTTLIAYMVMVICCISCMLNRYPVYASAIAAIIFVWLQGYFFCFEKLSHRYTTFTYAALLMPFFLYEMQGNNRQSRFLWLIQAAIALTYFFAGMEKILIGGTSWVKPETFQTYLKMHQASAGTMVASSTVLSTVLPVLALAFQLGFAGILYSSYKWRWAFILAGTGFHCGTVLLFNISNYFNPWIMVYIFFIDWSSLTDRIKRAWQNRKFF